MPKFELSDIAITHISLVKAGANGKEVIYKSAANEGEYENSIAIKKTDNEKGVIYGIVYAPDEVDSQGDFATSDEIEKAAYAFMKARNTTNVDVNHSFNNEAAFVAESWIVKGGDSIFPNEPEGSWAVAIKLEDEDLKALAKSGDIAGISMAGTAQKTEVEKGEGVGESKFKTFFASLADVVSGVWVDFGTYVEKSKTDGEMDMDKFAKQVKEKIEKSLKEANSAAHEMQKAADAQAANIEKMEEMMKSQAEQIEKLEASQIALQKENTGITEANQKLAGDVEKAKQEAQDEVKASKEKIDKLSTTIDTVKEGYKELAEVIKASKQSGDFKKIESTLKKNEKAVM